MAIDDEPERGSRRRFLSGRSAMDLRMNVILIVLAVLTIAVIYSITRISIISKAFQAENAYTRQELTEQFHNELSAQLQSLQKSNNEQLDALKTELDQASRHLGAQGGELKRARAMVAQLQTQHSQEMDALQHQLALKADQQQLGALTADVSNTKTDLSKTQQNVDELANKLGLARTRFGTLIARNHDEIEALRKLGQRNYYEFTLRHRHPIRVADVSLHLKKTNRKHHRFSLEMLVDDSWITKKNRTINEPIFFTAHGSRSFNELVVNKVDKGVISGYISTPKDASQVASRSEGSQ
ncbi:MAG: hypothetical protein P8Z30_09260 [Acidobacteriota bacterium]